MPREIIRGRDVILYRKGENYPVTVNAAMATSGWPGGQGVKWVTGAPGEFTVGYSDGILAGFLLWGSNEPPDQYTAITGNQPYYRFALLIAGGALFSTSTFEKYTYASRVGVGPLVPITYNYSDALFMSLRGLWTKEDEWDLSGDPRGALFEHPGPGLSGLVVEPPTTLNGNFLTVQTL